jgi:hypothetical protein
VTVEHSGANFVCHGESEHTSVIDCSVSTKYTNHLHEHVMAENGVIIDQQYDWAGGTRL